MTVAVRSALLILIMAGFVLGVVAFQRANSANVGSDIAKYAVTRRTIEDRVVERGTVESQNTVYGKCMIEGESKITFIAPEGSTVSKGDVVARLDDSAIKKEIETQQIAINEANGRLDEARQALEIQLNTNETNIATAQLEHDLAVIDLEKYEKGDFVAEVADLERAIKEAEAELEKIRDEKNNVEILVKKGYRTPQQLREYQLRETTFQFQVERDQQKLKVLVTYARKRQITELKAKAKENELKLVRAAKTADAERLKAEAAVSNAENGVAILETQMAELTEMQTKCVLIAEQDGTVAYANQPWFDPSERIRVGNQVWPGREIYYLPDMTKMQVKVNVHESVVDRLRESQVASIRLDAFSDQRLSGTVKSIAGMAASDRSSSQNYDTVVTIDELPAELSVKPGMTAEVDILVGVYRDVLAVPVGAVTEHFEQSYVYVVDGNNVERRSVEIGRVTHSFVEIVSGIDEGEEVALDAYNRGLDDFSEAERAIEAEELGASTDSNSAMPPDSTGT